MLTPPPLVECRNITFERDDLPLFSDVSFQLYPARALQVVGANGAGKTTLLRIIAGSLTASQGEILWQGVPVARCANQYRAAMVYLGHGAGIKGSLTPRENLRWYLQLFPQLRGDIDGALARVRLQGLEDIPCHTLSAGQQRRVSLARLYMAAAPLWVLDEPFTSIDVDGVAELESLMEAHLGGGGSILFTSHQPPRQLHPEVLDLERFAVAA